MDHYNSVKRNCRKVEFCLIESEITRIDSLIRRGEKELCWRSDNLMEYMTEIRDLVEDLHKRIKATQENIERVRLILEPWTKTPLIERKDRKKTTLLSLDERQEKMSRRFAEIKKGAEQILFYIEENKKLFQIKNQDSENWQNYIKYVDNIVIESLQKAIGCSLGYLVENMDQTIHNAPLLEAKLELREPDIYYVPSLEPEDPDGLDQLIMGLLEDIIGIATLVPRIKTDEESYREELEKDEDICAMKNEIIVAVNKAVEEASDFCEIFEGKFFNI